MFVSVVLESNGIGANKIHIGPAGSDSASGSAGQPYQTINHAASVAQPGDTVIVHGGTYREWVEPIRGGTSESSRIVYRAVPGDEALVKGSERITTWITEGAGVWKVEVPNSFFGDYNPYELTLSGGWLNYGQWHHRGDVYLNGEAFYEKRTAQEVTETKRTNFGSANPNTELTEINVRESILMPEVTGLKYITVDGFHFMHAAANWAPPVLPLQTGAVGRSMGRNWIIENCTVVNARCVGMILGHAPGVNYTDIYSSVHLRVHHGGEPLCGISFHRLGGCGNPRPAVLPFSREKIGPGKLSLSFLAMVTVLTSNLHRFTALLVPITGDMRRKDVLVSFCCSQV